MKAYWIVTGGLILVLVVLFLSKDPMQRGVDIHDPNSRFANQYIDPFIVGDAPEAIGRAKIVEVEVEMNNAQLALAQYNLDRDRPVKDIEVLVKERYLSPDGIRDHDGHKYRVVWSDDGTTFLSWTGPDSIWGTKDDIKKQVMGIARQESPKVEPPPPADFFALKPTPTRKWGANSDEGSGSI